MQFTIRICRGALLHAHGAQQAPDYRHALPPVQALARAQQQNYVSCASLLSLFTVAYVRFPVCVPLLLAVPFSFTQSENHIPQIPLSLFHLS